jgi:dipeptidyl aminopeptidase
VVDALDGSAEPDAIRVTDDGSETVTNGIPDWVYEEEVRRPSNEPEVCTTRRFARKQVFSANFAMWWSPKGDKLAFLKSDETAVLEYTLQYYNPSGDAFELSQYPKNVNLR